MTFRAKPVANKPRRQTRDSYSRRNTYLNIGFGLAVVLAVVILVGVAGFSYYGEHLAAAATVGGQTITRDDFKDAASIEVWRLQQQQARITGGGRGRAPDELPGPDADPVAPAAGPDPDARPAGSRAADRRPDPGGPRQGGRRQRHPRPDRREDRRGIDDAGAAPRLDHRRPAGGQRRARPTRPTSRRRRRRRSPTRRSPTSRPAARSGRTSRRRSRPTRRRRPAATSAGSPRTRPRIPSGWTRCSPLDPNKPTAVIQGDNGDYLIGKVTDVAAAQTDAAWLEKLKDAGLSVDKYRSEVSSEVLRQELDDKAVADAMASDKQRHILELALQEPGTPPLPGAVKVRHILFSPNHDPSKAQDLPAERPRVERRPAGRGIGLQRPGQGPLEVRPVSPATRATRRPPRATPAPAASCGWVDSSTNFVQAVQGRRPEAGPEAGRHPQAVQVRLRLARRPDHVHASPTRTR